jgi:hypothetical protein
VTLVAVRRAFGIAGIALLGGALAIAPVVAFGGDMRIVSGIGIAGIACLIVMRLLPRPPSAGAMDRDGDGGDAPPGRRNDA